MPLESCMAGAGEGGHWRLFHSRAQPWRCIVLQMDWATLKSGIKRSERVFTRSAAKVC